MKLAPVKATWIVCEDFDCWIRSVVIAIALDAFGDPSIS